MMAFGILQLEKSQELIRQEIQALIDNREPGGLAWYREKVLAYQHGDVLTIINNRPTYLVIDTQKQLVKHVSVVETFTNGTLLVKIAGDNLTQLSSDVVAGIATYLQRVKVAGTLITVQSLPADMVAYNITVEVDKSVIDASGKAINGSDTPIYDAIDKFHKNIDFNDVLYLSKVTDALQAVGGVLDVEITESRYFDTTWKVIDRKYSSKAGYVNLDRNNSNLTIV